MKLRHALFAVSVALFAVSNLACYRHTLVLGDGAPAGTLAYNHWENFWIIGIVGHTRVDVLKVCPSGDATIEAKQTFLNGLVSALTSGIYTPTTLRLRCNDGRTAAIPLLGDDVRTIVSGREMAEWLRTKVAPNAAAVETPDESASRRF
jgi:hypothetical protein